MKKKTYRDNNFTTKEIKEFATCDSYIIPKDSEGKEIDYEDELKELCEINRIDYDFLKSGEGSDLLIPFSVQADLSNIIRILSWKILYERDMHKHAIERIKEQLHDIDFSCTEEDDDVDTSIKDGDDEDYYDGDFS